MKEKNSKLILNTNIYAYLMLPPIMSATDGKRWKSLFPRPPNVFTSSKYTLTISYLFMLTVNVNKIPISTFVWFRTSGFDVSVTD